MKKMINKSHIQGLLYESTIEEKVSKKEGSVGNKYISGKLAVEVAEDNVVVVDIFENEITRAGKKNQKYDKLLGLMDANSVVSEGRENAIALKLDSALSLNDWYPQGKLVSTVRNFNGFINLISRGELNPSATFEVDMLITSVSDDMSKDKDDVYEPNGNLRVKGMIFDFADRVLPVEFTVENEAGVEYFRDTEPNTLTKVWGKQVTQSEVVTKVEESAFGDDKVEEYENTTKKLVITGTNKEPYLFGEEDVLTVKEVQEAVAARNVYLASKEADGKKSNKAPAATAGSKVTDPTNATFTF